MGLFADGLSGAQRGLDNVQVPYLGGLGGLLLGGAPRLADDISYQGLSALRTGGNAATGGFGTFAADPATLDLAGVLAGLGGLARPALAQTGKAVLPLAEKGVSNIGKRSMLNVAQARKQFGNIGSIDSKKGKVDYSIQEGGDWAYNPATGQDEWVDSPSVAFIEGLWVPESERSKGNGRKLMKDVIEKIRKENPGIEIQLSANPLDKKTDQQKLVEFYESLGFRQKPSDYEGVFMHLKK